MAFVKDIQSVKVYLGDNFVGTMQPVPGKKRCIRPDIFDKTPERLITILSANCRKRRLERGMSRRTLSQQTGVPAPTVERFERTGKISLESFCKIAIEFDWFDEMSALLSEPKFTTRDELRTINRNLGRKKGR